ncbi:MAG: carbohydrate kinase family protein [Eubacterium sp.]|nr:carbohydrate kinase family protein [Eubacterium sp.]
MRVEKRGTNQIECLFIGSATEDILMLVDRPPASDQRIVAEQVVYSCGGIAMVAGSAFHKLGGRAGLVTSIGGPSAASDHVTEAIRNYQLPFCQILEMPEASTSFSTILVEKNGKRLIANHGGSAKQITLDMIDHDALANAAMVHLGGVSDELFYEVAKYCKEHTDAVVSVDGGNVERETCDKILPYVDIYIPDHKTAERTLGLSPQEACRYYCDRGVKLACVTQGEEGCIALSEGTYYEAPAFDVPVVDTTGAGDNFHGAFLYGYLQGWDIEKILRFASGFSGLTCGALGGLAGEPTLEETMKLIET